MAELAPDKGSANPFVSGGHGDSTLKTCSPVNKWSDVSAYAQYIFPPQAELIGDEGTPKTDRLWFASPAQAT